MDRIQHSSATSDHQFTEGDPGNGVPATTVTAVHMNGVQNEVVHIIEEAGIIPDETNHTQLLQALGELFLAKDAESSTPVLEALVSNAVSGILTLDLGTRATSVVVVVKGNSSSALTLRLAGTVPSGSTVTVFNWNPGALTVALASGTLTGNSGTLALGDVAIVTKDTASTAWWLAAIPTRGTVSSLISVAVAAEAATRAQVDSSIYSDLMAETSSRSNADGEILIRLSAAEQSVTQEASARATADNALHSSVSALELEAGSHESRLGILETLSTTVQHSVSLSNGTAYSIPFASPLWEGLWEIVGTFWGLGSGQGIVLRAYLKVENSILSLSTSPVDWAVEAPTPSIGSTTLGRLAVPFGGSLTPSLVLITSGGNVTSGEARLYAKRLS